MKIKSHSHLSSLQKRYSANHSFWEAWMKPLLMCCLQRTLEIVSPIETAFCLPFFLSSWESTTMHHHAKLPCKRTLLDFASSDGGWVFWWALKTHRKDHVDIKVAIAKLPPPKEKIHANTWVYYKRAPEKPNPKLGKSSILIAWRGSEKLLSFFSL